VDLFQRELVIRDLGFLEADDIRVVARHNFL
jgi:hypothetical protein